MGSNGGGAGGRGGRVAGGAAPETGIPRVVMTGDIAAAVTERSRRILHASPGIQDVDNISINPDGTFAVAVRPFFGLGIRSSRLAVRTTLKRTTGGDPAFDSTRVNGIQHLPGGRVRHIFSGRVRPGPNMRTR